jgi:site-specific DNA-methyltransferase (adenine-specific)
MDSKVYNCDNMELMAKYPDGYFELGIIDPPYGIGMSKSAGKSKKEKDKKWDDKSPPKEFFLELTRITKNQIIWGANHFIDKLPIPSSPCWLLWDKREGFIPTRTYADGELAYTSFNKPARIFRHYWDGFMQREKEQRIHVTQKPVALYKWLLQNYAKEGDKILDTHLGSGSSRIACHDMKFDFTGCELDKDYFDAAEFRYQEHIKQLTLF